MATIDKDKIDNIKRNLNSTGIFLESYVSNFLKEEAKYGVKREVTYTIPDAGGFIEGECDIVASNNLAENKLVCFFIECKRASADDKYWVFEKGPMGPSPLFTRALIGDTVSYTHDIHLKGLNYNRPEDYEAAINIFEFDEKTGKRNSSIQKRERPFLALRQVNEAFSGLATDSRTALDIVGLQADQALKILFLPVVVTTANLLVANYEPKNVDYSMGTIDLKNIDLIEKGWVHFEFPLTGGLGNNFGQKKRSTFIVNVNSLSDFVSAIGNSVKEYLTLGS